VSVVCRELRWGEMHADRCYLKFGCGKFSGDLPQSRLPSALPGTAHRKIQTILSDRDCTLQHLFIYSSKCIVWHLNFVPYDPLPPKRECTVQGIFEDQIGRFTKIRMKNEHCWKESRSRILLRLEGDTHALSETGHRR